MTAMSGRSGPDAPAVPPSGPGHVESLAKGLRILAEFAGGELLGNQQLCERTGLPRSTVSRLTSTLVELGYLRTAPESAKFLLGARLLGMGARVQSRLGIPHVVRPLMQALAQKTQATVCLAAPDRLAMVCLEVAAPSPGFAEAGSEFALDGSAMGLACLVAAPVGERMRLIQALHHRPMPDGQRLRGSIAAAHEEYQRHGLVSWVHGLSGQRFHEIALPVCLRESGGHFVLSCALPAAQAPMDYLRLVLGPELLQAVRWMRLS